LPRNPSIHSTSILWMDVSMSVLYGRFSFVDGYILSRKFTLKQPRSLCTTRIRYARVCTIALRCKSNALCRKLSTGYCYGIDIDKTMMMHSRFWSVKCPSVWKTSRASRPKFWVRRSPRFCCRLHGAITLTPRISYGSTQVPTRPHHQTSQFTSHLFCRVPVSSPA